MLMRRRSHAALVAAAALALSGGHAVLSDGSAAGTADRLALTQPAGARITVRLASPLSSETARAGDAWTGTVVDEVVVGNGEVIPAGSTVRGIVTGAHPAGIGRRAMLDLAIQDVSTGDAPRSLTGGIDAIQAALPGPGPGAGPAVGPASKGAAVRLESDAELVFAVREGAAS